MEKLSKYFFHGLIIVIPIFITGFIVLSTVEFAENLVGRRLPFSFPGLGLFALLFFVLAVGWLSSHWLLRRLLGYGEKVLNSIPIIKFVYGSVKQLSTAVFKSESLFRQAVLVPYPHPESKALGFVMSDLSEPLAEKLPGEWVCVFIPMSLNMTAGVNIVVPKRDIIPLDITSESALQYLLTAGSIMPRGNE